MQFGPESLLPPLVAIILAIATRRVVVPLATGVFAGACLLAYAGNESWRTGDVMDEIGGWLRFLAGPETNWWDAPTLFAAGMMESVQIMRLENQGFFHGYRRPKDRRAVQAMFRELYCPSDKSWRMSVMEQTAEMWPVLMDRFIRLE